MSVSVVIPCYRCQATVERAVESVRAQTLRPDEVIFVDDASADGTDRLLRRLVAELQPHIRAQLVSLPQNRGPASARNAGWNAARGEYVAFLDSDATWHPDKLKIQLSYMEAHPEVAISGHLHVVTHRTAPLGSGSPRAAAVSFEQLLWSNRFVISSALVRRSLAVRLPEGQRHMEDHRLWLDAARAGHRMVRLEAVLAAHHKPEFGASGLSGDLLAMEKGELGNYQALFEAGAVGRLKLGLLQAWSLAKFARRLVIVGARRFSTARDT